MGTSADWSGRIFDFDPPSYGEARRRGLRHYRDFLVPLASGEGIYGHDSELAVRAQERPEWEAARRRALEALPAPEDDLPLRVLVAIAGNLTWGVLETFRNQPTGPDGEEPASQGLRDWYGLYDVDFRRLFPAQMRKELPSREDAAPGAGPELIGTLLQSAYEFAEASGRHSESALGLGVLLRDFADTLAPICGVFGFPIDKVVREYLLGGLVAGPLEPVLGTYQELSELLEPGPATMFCAFALTEGTPISGRFDRDDLFAAAGIGSPEANGLDPDSSVRRHARSDAPTAEDRLGIAPLVEGLRALLDDRRTELPLSIGLTAPWGGGKSSLMFQLRRALQGPSPGRHRTWIPIRFDAWKFERSERIWAALSRAIYEQSQEQMGRWERLRFKFALEQRRRSRLAFWGGPLLVAAVLVATVILALVHRPALPGVLGALLVVSGVGAALLGRLWGLLSDPFKRALNGYTSNPRYEEELGFTTEAEADIRDLTGLLTARPDHVLVVFVDDLDRCSPAHLVEAIEAINQIFNAAVYEPATEVQVEPDTGRRPGRCVFVLGMDREMVAAGIEVAYEATVERLPEARRRNFGLQFLAKIVALSVAVPKPGAEAIVELLEGGGGPAEELATAAASVATGPGADERASPRTGGISVSVGGLGVSIGPRSAPPWPPLAAAAFEPVPFDQDSAEFREAEREAVAHLDRNPRDVKRFDNAFRLQLHVAAKTPGCGLHFDRGDLIAIARWVALRLRWPEFADACDADDGLLARIEAAANPDLELLGEAEPPSEEDQEAWLGNDKLMALLRHPRPECRIARLQGQTFLRIS